MNATYSETELMSLYGTFFEGEYGVTTILSVDYIEASSTVADNSPQQFEGHETDFGDPCDPDDPGRGVGSQHSTVRGLSAF